MNTTGSTVTNAAPILANRGLSSQNVAHRPKTNLGSTVQVEKLNNQKMNKGASDYGIHQIIDGNHRGAENHGMNGHRPHTSHPTSNISSYRPIPSKNL